MAGQPIPPSPIRNKGLTAGLIKGPLRMGVGWPAMTVVTLVQPRKVPHGLVEPANLARHVLNGRQIKSDWGMSLQQGTGVIKWPTLEGSNLMQLYGDFEGFPLY